MQHLLTTFIFFISVFEATFAASNPTQQQIDDAWVAIEELIEGNERLAAKFLRLSFHDCVSPKCDGCINLSTPDNGGLQEPISALETIFVPDDHSQAMSRADFWALAGIVGLNWAIETANEAYGAEIPVPAPLTFKSGRTDCDDSPNNPNGVEHTFPKAHAGSDETFKFFKDRFDLSQYETVAVMGAHTIGRATKANVGFDGQWTNPEPYMFEFDATYHHILLVPDYGWHFENVGTSNAPKWQWRCTDLAKPVDEDRNCGFMLDSDIAMLMNLTVNAQGKPTCDFFTLDQNTCGIIQANFQQMQQYDDAVTPQCNVNVVNDFSAAFQKIIDRI